MKNLLFGVVVGLLGLGIFLLWMLNSPQMPTLPFMKKQIVSGLLALFVLVVISRVRYGRWERYAYPVFFISLGFLIITMLFAPAQRGSRRWLDLGIFSLQSSELAKVGFLLAMAALLKRNHQSSFQIFFIKSAGLLAFPFVLILKQPDLGTALLLVMTWLIFLFVHPSARWFHALFLGLLLAVLLPAGYHWGLHDYQKRRLVGFLNPSQYPLREGYQILQARQLIGAGGWWGYHPTPSDSSFHSTPRQMQNYFLQYIPERHNDFIFTTLAHKLGLAGVTLALLLYFLICLRGLTLLFSLRELFGYYLVLGVVTLLALQTFLNMAMNLGLAPITGVTLPFLSYGGSSNVAFGILIGFCLAIQNHPAITLDDQAFEGERLEVANPYLR